MWSRGVGGSNQSLTECSPRPVKKDLTVFVKLFFVGSFKVKYLVKYSKASYSPVLKIFVLRK